MKKNVNKNNLKIVGENPISIRNHRLKPHGHGVTDVRTFIEKKDKKKIKNRDKNFSSEKIRLKLKYGFYLINNTNHLFKYINYYNLL